MSETVSSKAKRIFFLEQYPPFFKYEEGEIISLDPTVSYILYRENISYRILEDFYDEKELKNLEEKYFYEQLNWFDDFDNFLKTNISYCEKYNIPLVRSNYLCIKYFVDTVIIYCHILLKLFTRFSDLQQVNYIYNPYLEDNTTSVFKFKYNDRRILCDLLRLFCEKKNISFVPYTTEKNEATVKSNLLQKSISKIRSNSFPIKDQLKKIFNFVKYNKTSKLYFQGSSLKDFSIVFMHAGSVDIDHPVKELIKHKALVYLMEHRKILSEDAFLRKQANIPRLDDHFKEKLKRECRICSGNLKNNTNIISWINDKCSLDVSSIILPYLKYFISDDCYYILQDAERMYRFYKQNRINYIFARGNTDRDSQGPLVAAKYMKGAKSVCVQHACFASDVEEFVVMDTETYNNLLTRDYISQHYYESSVRDKYKTGCRITQFPYYLKRLKETKARLSKSKRPERIVFVLKKFLNRVRCFNDNFYGLTWYAEFQKRLIDFFSKEDNFEIIYKHADTLEQRWAEHSILQYIKDKNSKNIHIFRKHFLKSLIFADRVIVDHPSSALFEAAAANKAVLCVCPDYFRIQTKAKDIFGKSLQQFSTIDEAKHIIKQFLHSNPKDYIVDIPLSRDNFIDAFRSIITA